MEESNEASSDERTSGPVLMCGKTLDAILAGRRGPAADSSKEPWWVPAVPAFEAVVVPSDWDRQSEGRSPHPSGAYALRGIEHFGESIVQTLLEQGDVIIQAEPGAGKTKKE